MVEGLIILAIGLGLIAGRRWFYQDRMKNLGIGVIGEAWRVKDEYPQEYPAYYDEAVDVLNSHGVGYLASYLPRP